MKNSIRPKLIIGIDGGASHSKAILFDDNGKTIDQISFKGSSLTVNFDKAPGRISKAINALCTKHNLELTEIDAIGLGLAGASNEDGRDKVFKELDRMQISNRAIIMSDAEAAYEISCPIGKGILVSIGTGVICMARNDNGEIIRTGGLGHDVDSGSGFWMGKEAMLKVALSDNTIHSEPDLMAISTLITGHFDGDDFSHAVESAMKSTKSVSKIASLCLPICQLADEGNDVALGIIQEATMSVAELIIELAAEMNVNTKTNPFIIAGNGSVLNNPLYRNGLRDALRFDIPHLGWVFSELSPAYGAGILASKFRKIPVSLISITEYLRADRSIS